MSEKSDEDAMQLQEWISSEAGRATQTPKNRRIMVTLMARKEIAISDEEELESVIDELEELGYRVCGIDFDELPASN